MSLSLSLLATSTSIEAKKSFKHKIIKSCRRTITVYIYIKQAYLLLRKNRPWFIIMHFLHPAVDVRFQTVLAENWLIIRKILKKKSTLHIAYVYIFHEQTYLIIFIPQIFEKNTIRIRYDM